MAPGRSGATRGYEEGGDGANRPRKLRAHAAGNAALDDHPEAGRLASTNRGEGVVSSFHITIMLAAVGFAVVLLLVLRRIWPSDSRRPYNDLIGWQIGVLGTT